MKKRNRQAVCFNCNRPLLQTDNFCPNCGQENTTNKLSVDKLLGEFFSNYFSFDSKLSRSTLPFVLKPGFLTLRFNEGKRSSYVHPLRLYFIISFIFFFLLAVLINRLVEEEKITFGGNNSIITFDDDTPPNAMGSIQHTLDSVRTASDSAAGVIAAPDSVSGANPVPADSASLQASKLKSVKVLDMMRDPAYTDEQVLKRMEIKENSDFSRMMVHQGRKVVQKDIDVFLPYLIKNFSIMMFLLLPVFAFYIYLLFRRKEPYYISHAIHALHLHSFSFLIFCLCLMITLLSWNSKIHETLFLVAFMIITLYAFISVKRVYKQGWISTFLKFNVLGFFYFMTLMISITLEIWISFMLF